MRVEVYASEHADTIDWVFEFDALPRVGEYLSLDAGGYFAYYFVVEVWHRQEPAGAMQACLRVELRD